MGLAVLSCAAGHIAAVNLASMETEKLPLRQAFFGLIFAVLFVIVGAIAVSASYGNEGGDSHSEEVESNDADTDAGTEEHDE